MLGKTKQVSPERAKYANVGRSPSLRKQITVSPEGYNISTIVEQQSIVAKLENLSSETKTLEAIYQKKLDNFRGIKEKPVKRVFRGELTRD